MLTALRQLVKVPRIEQGGIDSLSYLLRLETWFWQTQKRNGRSFRV